MTFRSDLAVILYYEILRLGVDHDRVYLVFDSNFNGSLEEDIRNIRSSFNGNTGVLTNMGQDFPKNFENKNTLKKYIGKEIIKLHHGPKF